jgi:hypothetical protein
MPFLGTVSEELQGAHARDGGGPEKKEALSEDEAPYHHSGRLLQGSPPSSCTSFYPRVSP